VKAGNGSIGINWNYGQDSKLLVKARRFYFNQWSNLLRRESFFILSMFCSMVSIKLEASDEEPECKLWKALLHGTIAVIQD
jgi:hypothetical protein